MKRLKRENPDHNELLLKNEMAGILFLFLAFFLLFSLISYSPLDPSFFHTSLGKTIRNFGGKLGAEIAAFLFNLFGYASFLFILVLLFFTAFFLFNRKIKNILTKSSGLFMLLLSFSAFLANITPKAQIDRVAVKTGGIIGYFLNQFFVNQLKPFFSLLLFVSLMLISAILIAKISIRNLLVFLFAISKRLLLRFKESVGRLRETQRKKKRSRQIQQKYSQPEVSPAKEKTIGRPLEAKAEKKSSARQPSKLPEETYLFSEFDKKAVRDETYTPPPLTYLDAPSEKSKIDINELEEKKQELAQRLQEFRINGEIVEFTPGPVITTYEFVPDVGVKVKDVSSLTEDLALAVKAPYVRIERILGKKAIGIEIPNKKRETIHLREILRVSFIQKFLLAFVPGIGQNHQW